MCVVMDTNVPMIANLFTRPDSCSDIPYNLILESIRHIKNITEKDCRLVIDDAGGNFPRI